MTTTIDICALFMLPEAAAEFARQAITIRDSWDGRSATQWRAWDALAKAARAAESALMSSASDDCLVNDGLGEADDEP